jgi:malonate transporter
MTEFLVILQAVAPVFLITFLGIGLKKIQLIDDHFVEYASKLVFNVALPALVFTKLATLGDFPEVDFKKIGLIYVGTILCVILIWVIGARSIRHGADLGSFVHGSFRSNYAIVGFAVILNVFGEEALASAAIILAFIMPLYNFLAIFVLTVTTHCEDRIHIGRLLKTVLTNPLILAVVFALPFSLFGWTLPSVISETTGILARMALPLALIGIGGQMDLESLRKASGLAFSASAIKLIFIPTVLTFAAIQLGYRGDELGILFLLFAAPSAVASFIMAKAMHANSKLAGNIILITTLCATLTITMGLFLLRRLGYL